MTGGRGVVALGGAMLGASVLAVTALTAPAAQAAATSPQAVPPQGGTAPPPAVHVLLNRGGLAPGYTFLAPKAFSNPVTTPSGPEIVDSYGRPVWWHQVPSGESATDFRVQTYRGRPVLTWNEGRSSGGPGHSAGVDYIADTHYRIIATVRAGDGLAADQHEFQLTPQGTALITAYDPIHADLRSVGGPRNGLLLDSHVQEIDVRTGKVLLDWDAAKHVRLSDSYQPLPADPSTTPWDFFHVNAAHLDTDGNLLINSRHTWTVYKVQRHTGKIIWRLGGKRSSFRLGPGVHFAWEHDVEAVSPGVIRLFDNESNGTDTERSESRIITIRLDLRRHTARLVSVVTHPDHLLAASQGNAQLLPDGHLLVGWGQLGRISEFDRRGRLIFDAQVPAGDDDYRAYRFVWNGEPLTRPTATVEDGVLHAVWNGATGVATWQVYGGTSARRLQPVAAVPWNGLDTALASAGSPAFVKLAALDAQGRVVGTSAVTATG